jgi:succinate dehydrogenase / fumarate reductase cytochrome b subunit
MNKNNSRPRFLNPFKIKMPVTAVLSIAHRISGLLMVMSIPFVIYAFQLSVSSEEGFSIVMNALQQTWVNVILIGLTWSLSHHFVSGIRFLLIDIDVGVEKQAARFTAWVTHAIALTITVVVAGALL